MVEKRVDLAEGWRLLKAATPEPWAEHVVTDRFGCEENHLIHAPDSADPAVAETFGERYKADASLIVWLRNNAKGLLSAAEERAEMIPLVERLAAHSAKGGTGVAVSLDDVLKQYGYTREQLDAMPDEEPAT